MRPPVTSGCMPPTGAKERKPFSSMLVIIKPTSSIWAESCSTFLAGFFPFLRTSRLPSGSPSYSAWPFICSMRYSRTAASRPLGPRRAHRVSISFHSCSYFMLKALLCRQRHQPGGIRRVLRGNGLGHGMHAPQRDGKQRHFNAPSGGGQLVSVGAGYSSPWRRSSAPRRKAASDPRPAFSASG